MAHGLPTSVILKSQSSNKYLRYLNMGGGSMYKFLQFSGEKALSLDSMFELEIPKSAEAAELGLVHIRSTYNNRYWQRWSETSEWIVSTADEPEEDQSKWSCTLFHPSFVDDDSKARIRLSHVQLKSYVSVWKHAGNSYESCLFVGSSSGEADDSIFEIINCESLVVLPQYVAFKGPNGLYLKSNDGNGLQFESVDLKDPSVTQEVVTSTNDDRIRLKSVQLNKFWRKDIYGYISADSDDTKDEEDANTLFLPVKLNHNHVALQNMGNNLFAKRFSVTSISPKLNYLAARDSNTADEETHLEVIEPVASRQICDVVFRLKDARIYNKKDVTLFTEVVRAPIRPLPIYIPVTVMSYTKTNTSIWDSYYPSFKLGLEVKLDSRIPYIQENGKIVVQDEFKDFYKWGELKTSTTDTSIDKIVIARPGTLLKVSVKATECTYDVPFSYTQIDTLYNGARYCNLKDDGIYTGTNTYGFEYKEEEERLYPRPIP